MSKISKFILPLLIASPAFARTNLFKKPADSVEPNIVSSTAKAVEVSARKPSSSVGENPDTKGAVGLHQSAETYGTRNWTMVSDGNVIVSAAKSLRTLNDLRPGDLLPASIRMSVIAFSDGKAPVVAELYLPARGQFVLLGEATLQQASKRISVQFKSIRKADSDVVYSFKASALEADGTVGLKGELHSGSAKFFPAELASAAAAGFADSTVSRSTNALGNTIEQPSLDTHAKKALSSAMLHSAERFGEIQKAETEYSTLEGPVVIQVLIEEQPKITIEGGK
ncbi:MAG: hypothetical protein EOP06_08660 [Proteobacteria bacterium]|nr:MAG: hypothetical protein EOP06_08660 [Pseudomonadota bacterium]